MADQKHAVHSGADAAEGDERMAASADPSATARHTPTPWTSGGTIYEHMCADIRQGNLGEPVAQVWQGPHGYANAEFIVRAVNSHDELIFALKTLADDHRQLLEANSLDRSSAPNGYAAQSLAALALAKAEGRG